MDEKEMDRIEQEQYMKDLGRYIAEQRDIIRQCTERTEEIQERLNELQEDFEWEGLPETDEIQDLYAELFDLGQQLTEATERESFYRMQLFREELKEKSPSEIMELFDRISKDRIHFMKQDMEQEKNQQIVKEITEQYQIIEEHILSSDELSNLLSQRNKASKPEVSQEIMDWIEGRPEVEQGETSPLQQKNEYTKYSNWINIIRQQCNEKNYVRTEFLEGTDSDSSIYDQYDHHVLDNGLHIYINDTASYSGGISDSVVWIFEGESLRKYENDVRRSTQRSIRFDEFSEDGFYNFQLDFTVGNVKAYDNIPGFINYVDDMELGVAFLPDKAGRNAVSAPEIYLDENFDLSNDIKEKLEDAIIHTDDTELQSTYQKALEFYTKVYDLVKSQIQDVETQSPKKESLLRQKEAELSSLEAEEKTISETEKLIAQKENEGQTI